MTMMQKLTVMRSLKKGQTLLVCEPFTAFYADLIPLPMGTRILVEASNSKGVFGIADLGNKLERVHFNVEHYHCVEIAPD
jgi:hypothetical protein